MQGLVKRMSCDQEGPLRATLKLSRHPEHAATLPAQEQVYTSTKAQAAISEENQVVYNFPLFHVHTNVYCFVHRLEQSEAIRK